MKKITIIALLLMLRFVCPAQGIYFEQELSWKQVTAKAKKEHKYIFVDCYATWCIPCKFMSENIFSKNEIGDFFNANFVNVTVQMDQTAADAPSVKSWYGHAKEMIKQYEITSYPTYLFFSPDGTLVHRLVGATKDPAHYLSQAKHALDPNKQYYTLQKQLGVHMTDTAFLHGALASAWEASHESDVAKISDLYVAQTADNYQKSDLPLIAASIASSSAKGFGLLLNHASTIDNFLHSPGWAEGKISKIIVKEQLAAYLKTPDNSKNWIDVENNLKTKYPAINALTLSKVYTNLRLMVYSNDIRKRIFDSSIHGPDWKSLEELVNFHYNGFKLKQLLQEDKIKYYASKEKWEECAVAAIGYLEEYGEELSDRDLNNLTWDYVFSHSNEQSLLKKALAWSKKSVNINPRDYQNMDTYANLLFKIGDRNSAIKAEKEAIKLLLAKPPVDPSELKELELTLKKMESNEKTWL